MKIPKCYKDFYKYYNTELKYCVTLKVKSLREIEYEQLLLNAKTLNKLYSNV